jgi:HK97 family phage prohead protease
MFMELRDVAEARREIVGVVAPFDETTYLVADPGGERLKRGCFAKSIAERGDRIPLLVGHAHDRAAIGLSRAWTEDRAGLVGTFAVKVGPAGDDALADAAGGYLPALSVGFLPTKRHRAADGAAEVTEARLHEVSLVPVGAYTGAAVLAVRAAVELDPVILERFQNPPRVDLTPYARPWLR